MKYLTFSFDDGVTQDIRLIHLLNKYGMKATFNLNSDLLGQRGSLIRDGVRIDHSKNKPEDVKYIYAGHEVAAHTLSHPNLKMIQEDEEVVRQAENDRVQLSELCGYEVVGMAYPCGGECYDERVIRLLRECTGIKYARTTNSTYGFGVQNNLFAFNPSVYYHEEMDVMFELGERFLKLKSECPQIFYIWGHSYEFDINDSWGRFEEFLQMMANQRDMRYCTNSEALLRRL